MHSPMKLSRLTSPASALRFEALRDPPVLGVLSLALSCSLAVQRLADEKYALLKADPHHPTSECGCGTRVHLTLGRSLPRLHANLKGKRFLA